MFADAVRAEGYRLARSRTTWFWSVLFVPIVTVVFGTIGSFVVHANGERLAADTKMPPELMQMLKTAPLNVAAALVDAAGELAGPAGLLFLLIGAATLYAGDYRWETWRLIRARNTRPNLLLGKVAVLGGLTVLAMLAMLTAALIENVLRGVIFERALTFRMDAGDAGRMAALMGLSWLRILQFTMMGLLTAVVTRSLLAALFVPLVVGVAQFFSPQVRLQMGIAPDSWLAVLTNPSGAAETIKALIEGGPRAADLPEDIALKSWISLLAWLVLPLAGALAWFERQDLSKE